MRLNLLFVLLLVLAVPRSLDAAPSAEAFGTLPIIADIAISPNGKEIAYFVNARGNFAIQIMSLDGSDKERRLVGLAKDTKPGWITWVSDERVLAQVWNNMRLGATPVRTTSIYTLHTETLEGRFLIRSRKGRFRQFKSNVIDFLHKDPDHILMQLRREESSGDDLFRVNVANGRKEMAKRGRETIQDWYTDLRGEIRVGQGISPKSRDNPKWSLTIRDADSDKWRDGDEYPGLEDDDDIFGFTSNPNELVIGRQNGKPTQGLYVYDLAKKEITRSLFHNDTYDVSGLVLNGAGTEVLGASYYADQEEVELFDGYRSALDKVRERFPNYRVSFIDQSADEKLALLSLSSPSDPGYVLLMENATSKLQQLATYRDDIKAADLGKVISTVYETRDDVSIRAYITVPPGIAGLGSIQRMPFIVLPHGGPNARDVRHYDNWAHFFATRGYGVLQMNFRGSSGFGESHADAGLSNWETMQLDIEDGARWLLSQGYADPERLCIAGWSFGGYAALMGAVKHPDLYQCAISVAGVTDLSDLVNDMKKYQFGRYAAHKSILSGFKDRATMLLNSPVQQAKSIRIPVFLAHGELDQRVHYDQFTRMVRALRKSPSKVVSITLEDDDHYMSNQENQQQLYRSIEQFLEETLGPSEFKR